jgi:hypothetical protein
MNSEKSIADISTFESLRTQANETLGMQSSMTVFDDGQSVVDNMSPPLIPDQKVAGYKFFIGGGEGLKPHVHVKVGDKEAKIWLDPVSVKSAGGMKPHEINAAKKHIEASKQTFMEQYRKYYPLPAKPERDDKSSKGK